MKIQADIMGKQLSITTKKGGAFAGLCWGVYGSIQCQEEYGRSENALELYHDGMSTILFESEIEHISVI